MVAIGIRDDWLRYFPVVYCVGGLFKTQITCVYIAHEKCIILLILYLYFNV
jgi:hypothetical protein